MITTNICIVGAGPGGVMTALTLAKNGIPSILVDKATFPRHKADSDGLTPNVIRALYELDPTLLQRLVNEQKDNIQGITHFGYFNDKGKGMTVSTISKTNESLNLASTYSCTRYDFDHFMINEVKRQPLIQLLENVAIYDFERLKNDDTEGGMKNKILLFDRERKTQIQCNLVVIASGSISTLKHKLAKMNIEEKEYGAGYRIYFNNVHIKNTHQATYIFDRRLLPGGMCILPMPNNMASVSIFIRMFEVNKYKINLKERLLEVLHSHPILKDDFKDAVIQGKPLGAPLHLGIKDRNLSGDNYILVGDAAGLADPVNANGIGHALISGKIAADMAIECIEKQDFSYKITQLYTQRMIKRLKNSLSGSRYVYRLFNYPRLMSVLSDLVLSLGSTEASYELMNAQKPIKMLFSFAFWKKLLSGKQHSINI